MQNGDIGLTHTHWRLDIPGSEAMEGVTAEIVRRQSDGTWKYLIDNPWGWRGARRNRVTFGPSVNDRAASTTTLAVTAAWTPSQLRCGTSHRSVTSARDTNVSAPLL